jgi:hypothetical protein
VTGIRDKEFVTDGTGTLGKRRSRGIDPRLSRATGLPRGSYRKCDFTGETALQVGHEPVRRNHVTKGLAFLVLERTILNDQA